MGQQRAHIDDWTRAEILELRRTPNENGKTRSYQSIREELKADGRNVSTSTIARLCNQAHEETIGEANREVREKAAKTADNNLRRIETVSDLLASAVETGEWPNGEPCSGQPRVMAAREAITGSAQLLAYIGVQDQTSIDAEGIVSAARRLYGLGIDDDADGEDSQQSEEDGDGGQHISRVPWQH